MYVYFPTSIELIFLFSLGVIFKDAFLILFLATLMTGIYFTPSISIGFAFLSYTET
jgi:hypothetical protein